MEDTKKRAAIRNQAAKRKEMDEGAKGMGLSRPSVKKRPLLKGDHVPKKQKVSTEPVIDHGPSTGQSKEAARLAP